MTLRPPRALPAGSLAAIPHSAPRACRARRFARARKRRIFREKTVPRVNGVHASFLGETHDALHVEISLDGPLAVANQIRFVGFKPMKAQTILMGEDGDRVKSELVRGAQDTNGDFAAIEGEKFFHRRKSPKIFSPHHSTRRS